MDSPESRLGGIITGYWQSQAVYVAAKLDLAELCCEGPQSVDSLAVQTNTHPGALFRLLRALASIGIFEETATTRHFANTPSSELLRSSVPGSQRAMAIMMGEEHYRAWGELLHSIKTGEGSFRKLYGKRVFEYLAEEPEQAAVFDAAMTSIHGRETGPMLSAYDYSSIQKVADIGGGNGSVLRELLSQQLHLRGILFDLPHVVARARKSLTDPKIIGRCEIVGGNFFEEIPVMADLYLLRHILHDWLDEECVVILRNIRRAMPEASRVLMIETVVQSGNQFDFVKWLDLTMLLIPEGRERTETEYQEILHQAGLELSRIIPTSGGIHLIEALPR